MKENTGLHIPDTVRYDAEHEWISQEAPHRIGVSDFAQDQLGDLTYVELPEVGASFAKGDEFGSLESTKSVSPLYSPADCTVVAVNETLEDDPGLVNTDPYGEGWIIEVELKNASQLDELMDADAYRSHVA
ncbi:MAG: glycine cleavage system protein GcvH [Deltaproteobacteria bacterium]|nr:glycine cleavage system protein GcvH [Deltaproteobacteria bacterium]